MQCTAAFDVAIQRTIGRCIHFDCAHLQWRNNCTWEMDGGDQRTNATMIVYKGDALKCGCMTPRLNAFAANQIEYLAVICDRRRMRNATPRQITPKVTKTNFVRKTTIRMQLMAFFMAQRYWHWRRHNRHYCGRAAALAKIIVRFLRQHTQHITNLPTLLSSSRIFTSRTHNFVLLFFHLRHQTLQKIYFQLFSYFLLFFSPI